jgi:hypothetical protein
MSGNYDCCANFHIHRQVSLRSGVTRHPEQLLFAIAIALNTFIQLSAVTTLWLLIAAPSTVLPSAICGMNVGNT